jgi:hypothetical protein
MTKIDNKIRKMMKIEVNERFNHFFSKFSSSNLIVFFFFCFVFLSNVFKWYQTLCAFEALPQPKVEFRKTFDQGDNCERFSMIFFVHNLGKPKTGDTQIISIT